MSKKTRVLNIKYFIIKNCIDKDKIIINYCSTNNINSDYITKLVQDVKYNNFWNNIIDFK